MIRPNQENTNTTGQDIIPVTWQFYYAKRFSDKVMFTFGPAFQYYSLDSTDNFGRNILTTRILDKTTLLQINLIWVVAILSS